MLHQRMEKLRTQNKLTKRDLAKQFGVAESTYGKWELGQRKPDTETITLIAKYYNVSVDYLLGNTDDPTPPGKKKPTPETVGPALIAMLKEHGYMMDDQPLTDEEADEILRITKAVWEARKPQKKSD